MKNTTKTQLSILITTLVLSQSCAESRLIDCDNGARRCNNNQIETCTDGSWTFSMACNADICTNDSQGNPFCKPDSNCLSKCSDGILSLCQTDGSSSIENCANKNMICGLLDDGTPACVDKTQTCQSICKEGLLSICHEDGSVTTQNCANNNMICGLLDDGTLTCVVKTQSCQSTCKNNILSQCHEDGSITTKNCSLSGMICGLDEAGSPTCVDDPNRKQCTLDGKTLKPGQKACDADGNVVTCNEDGTTSSTPCERGVCTDGDCIPRNCGNVADGQKTCQNLKLMVCDDGKLVEADPGCSELMLCRDGDSECSNYNACDTIAHNAHGCLDSNIVLCNDGTTSLVEDCVANNQSCAPNEEADCGFYCKSPAPTDCDWNGGVVEIDQTVCDGNLLKTCSAEVNTQFDEGRDCVDIDPAKPVCDVNVCREEKYCGNELEIAPGDIVCNEDETNKAECVDGTLVDLTDDDACSARENAHPVCTYTSEAVCSDVCDTGFTDVNGSCETIKICDAIKEIYQESTNTCTCNNDTHYVGEAGNCHCDTGYFEIQNQCKVGCLYADIEYQYGDSTCSSEGKVMTCQPDGSMLDATCEIGVCINGECDIRDCGDLKDGETRCQSGSLMMCSDGTLAAASTPCTANQLCLDGQNACVDKKVCTATGTMLNSQTNTCICNINKGWFGDGMTCDCRNGDVPIGDECVPKATCDETKETYVSATNSCACNTTAHWTGAAGACTCETNYFLENGECVSRKACNINEIYHADTNTCSCAPNTQWNSTTNTCVCKTGFYQNGNTCSPDDAQHCRGIDCTAVSYWGEGICTDAGECQVTSCAGDYHLYENGTTKTCEANSIDHCGNHDTQCDPAGSCENGTCICADDKTFCGDVCIDLKTDIDNCGECGKACAYGLSCINGKCLGNTNCGGVSYNTATSLDHCGTCNHRCSDGTTCIKGECVAGNGPAYCGGTTVQLNTPEHCESCAPCADGLICQNNQCVSGQGKMICNHIVVNSTSDSANCGSCGNVCNAGFKCVNSSCQRITSLTSSTTITCNAKTVKPYTDHDNCAGCNIACSSTSYCKAGVCNAWVVGDIITFGHYEQDNVTTNGKEPITWRVLDIKDGKFLLISEKALDVQPYNTTYISITWEKSTIRSWLNGYDASYNTVGTSFTSSNFINTAFTAEEKAKIVASNVPAHANPSYSTSPGVATTDKIFLLSITEANNYFKDNADRKADATRYAVKKGAYVHGSSSGKYTSDGTCTDVHCSPNWWLRSPGRITRNAAAVNADGSVRDHGHNVDDVPYAVRPALWVNL